MKVSTIGLDIAKNVFHLVGQMLYCSPYIVIAFQSHSQQRI